MNNLTTGILFIDSSVDSYKFLLEGIVGDIETIVLDSKRDGVEQITEILETSRVETVHIVSHGSPGCLYLGNSQLSLGNLEYYTQQIDNWGCENLFLYGCNVAAGDAGEEFIEKLHRLTGANIAASKTKTGNAEFGGDWELEVRVGKDFGVEKEISLIFEQNTLAEYSGVFEPNENPSIAITNNTLNYTENAIQIIDAEATVTDIDSPNFNNGTLTVRFTSGNTENDRLSIRNQGTEPTQINVENTIIKYGDVEIATFSGGVATEELVINLNENATPTAVQALLRNITYQNVSDNPDTTERNVEFIVTDGQGGISEAVSKSISITAVNDAPRIDKPIFSVDENAEKGTVVGTLTATDPEGTTDFSNWKIDDNSKHDLDRDGRNPFAINANTGEITVNDSDDLDYEVIRDSWIGVSVSDGQDASKFSTITIKLNDVTGTNVEGTSENDILYGTPEAETIQGKEGNDNIHGMGGGDTLDGGEGIDTIRETRDGDFRLDDERLRIDSPSSRSTEYSQLESIERAVLRGGKNRNRIDAKEFSGNVYLSGGGENDTLIGGRGNDNLSGGEGNDTLDGGEGIDTVRETADADFRLSTSGSYIAYLYAYTANTREKLGSDRLYSIEKLSLTGGESNNRLDVERFNGSANLSGKGGNDSLTGGSGNDTLIGGEGNDYLDGGDGIDTVIESADANFIFSSSSYSSSGEYNGRLDSYAADGGKQIASNRLEHIEKIYVTGGESNNNIKAARVWADVNLKGLGGDDTLIGGYGVDTLSGGEGNDSLDGGYGFDIVQETADVSFQIKGTQLIATDSNTGEQLAIDKFRYIQQFELTGGESNNIINTSEFDGYVKLKGLGGNDSLKSGSANDTLSGGEGSDTIDGGGGIDIVIESADVNFKLTDNQLTSTEVETGNPVAIDKLRNIERVVLTTGESNNKIDASEFSGSVNISAKDGNDTLTGGSGNDNLSGGEGDDTIVGGEGTDTVRETADADFRYFYRRENEGYLHRYDSKTGRILSRDTLINIERLALTGGESKNRLEVRNFNGTVNFSGKGGNDSLVGGFFNDTLSGGTGNDTLDGGEGIDTLRETGDVNFTLIDSKLTTSEAERGSQLDTDIIRSIEKASLTGGESRNDINAREFSGSVNLSGKGGNDTLVGGRGNDTLSGGTGSDTIDGGEGIDSLRETADVDFELQDFQLTTKDSNSNSKLDTDKIQSIERVSLTGGGRDNQIIAAQFSGSVNISGEGGRDTLVGGSANDTLSGGEGDDTLIGGEGTDTLRETADVDFRFSSSTTSSRTPYNGYLYSYKANTRENWGRDRLEDIERLALTGGQSNNRFDVENFKGNVNLSGKGGDDTLIGGIGNDNFSGGEGSDIIDGGDGVDSLREAADVNFKLEGDARYSRYRIISYDSQTLKQLSIDSIQSIEKISLSGGESDNKIDASQAYMSVNLSGKGGNDTVIGSFYNDILSGGTGDDTIDGSEGIDTLQETADADFRVIGNRIESYDSNTRKNLATDEIKNIEKISLTGGESNNRLEARDFDGNVNLSGKGGRDTLLGGRGNDILSGGEGNDTLDGGEGIDTLRETADVDFRLKSNDLYTYDVDSGSILDRDSLKYIERASLTGGENDNKIDAQNFEGDVNLSGRGGRDTLYGGSGNDTLSGGEGNDTLDGGDGIDTIRETRDVDFRLSGTNYLLSYESGTTRIIDQDLLKDIERISLTGGEGYNKIDTSFSKDSVILSGKGGRDTLLGGSGNDTLSGGEDYDTLDGGEGIDTLRETADVDFSLNDKQLEISWRTRTTIQRSTDRLISIERAVLTGGEYNNKIDAEEFTGNVNLSGKGGDDTLIGGSGNDIISGGTGNDAIDGGDGIDTLRETADGDFKLESYSSQYYDSQLKFYDSRSRQLLSTDAIVNIERISLTGGDADNKFDASKAYTSVNFAGKGGDDTLIGGYGNDTFSGGVGNDVFGGGAGFDTIQETADADFRVIGNRIETYDSNTNLDRDEFYDIERIYLTGGQSNNRFEARDYDGDVKFSGKAGDDSLLGGRGNDTLSGGIGNDTIDGGEGIDTIQETADVNFRLTANQLESIEAGTQIVLGTDEFRNIERVFLSGGESNNTIDASNFAGNVNLSGKGGKDNLLGGSGNDTLSGGEGYDILNGGEGIDTVREAADVDFKVTSTGSLESYKTNTTTILDKDLLKSIERILLTGGESNNKIDASESALSVNFSGKGGNDTLLGGSGNDTLSGGTGSDTIDGGDGIDTFRETADIDFKLTNTGSLESYEANTDTVLDTDLLQNIERIFLTGGKSDNKIDASQSNNSVNIAGKSGDDTLIGGEGNDTLSGGEGNDTIDGGSGTDYLRETENANFLLTDISLRTFDSNTNKELGQDVIKNIERAILIGGNYSNIISASGFSGISYLYGREGNDSLIGGSGTDNLYGGQGNDTLDGGDGIDYIRETVDANFTLRNTSLETRTDNVNILGIDILRNIERAVLSGGASNNKIDARDFEGSVNLYGRDGRDTLIGGSGNDNLYGGEGDDTLDGGEGIDTIRETVDGDFRLSDDYLDSNEANTRRLLGRDRLYNVERAALTGGESNNFIDARQFSGNAYLYGKGGNDTLLGGSGNDYIKAGEGDDVIDGGAGNDRLYGGDGKDTFVLTSVAGKDTIYDFEDSIDTFKLSGGLTFSDLNFKMSGNNTNILQGNQTLATLIGIDSTLLDQSDFT